VKSTIHVLTGHIPVVQTTSAG